MRRPCRSATFLLAGGLLLTTPVLSACGEEDPVVEEPVGTDTELEQDIEDLDDEGADEGVEQEPAG